jgi:hypothetical protein
MIEAEWRQVLRGSLSTRGKEDKSSTGRVWAAGFKHVTASSGFARAFKIYEPFFSLIFQLFFGPR